jgi:DNA-binding MarR family transcriptional regulator
MSEWSKVEGCNPDERWFESNWRFLYLSQLFTIFVTNIITMTKKIGTIAWHQQKIDEIRATHSKRAKKVHKSKQDDVKEGYGNTLKITTEKPTPRYRSRVEYDFLKYIRIVFKWAVDNNPELSRPQIELLLYLYGTGAFSRKQFNDYHKLVGMYSIKTLKKFEEEGWIRLWRKKKGREYALYTLTQKAKILCNKMHKYSCGEEEMPDDVNINKMARKDAPRINKYYLEMIKRMNKDKAPTE